MKVSFYCILLLNIPQDNHLWSRGGQFPGRWCIYINIFVNCQRHFSTIYTMVIISLTSLVVLQTMRSLLYQNIWWNLLDLCIFGIWRSILISQVLNSLCQQKHTFSSGCLSIIDFSAHNIQQYQYINSHERRFYPYCPHLGPFRTHIY